MNNPIIKLEKPIELREETLMHQNGSITQKGMEVLDKLWHEKEVNSRP